MEAEADDPVIATSAFVVAIVLNVAIGLVVFIAYTILQRISRIAYAPKTLESSDERIEEVYGGWCSWIGATIRADEETVKKCAGYDAVMHLRLFKFGMILFSVFTVLGCSILIPVYATGGNGAGGLDQISLTNISLLSGAIAAPFVVLWAFSIIIYVVFIKLCQSYFVLRKQYHEYNTVAAYTVLVRDIPKWMRSDADVVRYFKDLYPHAHISAAAVPDLRKLRNLVNERNKKIFELERYECKLELAKKKAIETAEKKGEAIQEVDRPTKRLYLARCAKVDAIDHTHKEIAKLQDQIKEFSLTVAEQTGSAFVTFSRATAAINCRATDHAAGVAWNVHRSPAPNDVYWNNIYLPNRSRTARRIITWFITISLVILYIVPLTFVSTLTTLDNLMLILPFLQPVIVGVPALAGFLQGFLPTLAVLIFFSILPTLMRAFSIFQGISSHSGLQRGMFSKLFLFYVIAFYFTVLVGSSILAALPDIISNPSILVSTFGRTIPSVGIFFTSYVMLAALGQAPSQLLDIVRFLKVNIKLRLLAVSNRDRENFSQGPDYSEGASLPQELVVTLIALTYSVLSPIIIPFALLYFAFGWFVRKRKYILLYHTRYDSGGLWFEQFSRRFIACIWIAQFMVSIVLGVKLDAYAPYVLFNVPLLLATIAVGRYIQNMYIQDSRDIPLQNAREMVVAEDMTDEMIKSYTHKCLGPVPLRESEMQVFDAHDEEATIESPLADHTPIVIDNEPHIVDDVASEMPAVDVDVPVKMVLPVDIEHPEPVDSKETGARAYETARPDRVSSPPPSNQQ